MEIYFFDDSKVKKARKEMQDHFQKNAELFFEREVKDNLNEKAIYCDESIGFLDKFIREKVIYELGNKRLLYIILIGAYLGQYVITKFKGNWVFDAKACASPLDYFIRYTEETDLYFRPFASSINRINLGKRASLKSEISIIRKETKRANEGKSGLKK
jgi:hypothetical protein